MDHKVNIDFLHPIDQTDQISMPNLSLDFPKNHTTHNFVMVKLCFKDPN